MAIVVIGGLITSTFLSLLVIPVVFTYVDDLIACSAVAAHPRLPERQHERPCFHPLRLGHPPRAFGIERAGRRFRIPPVILLIAAGMLTKPLLLVAGWTLAGLDMVVPIIGTIGLVLIVLEGSLDISLSRERLYSARAAMWMALLAS